MEFGYQDIFGVNALALAPVPGDQRIRLNKWTFVDEDLSGELPVGIGIDDPDVIPSAVQMLYGILMLVMQNQTEGEYDDPEQMVHIINEGRYVETGTRTGQTRQSFLVSFYTETEVGEIPGISQID